MPLDEKVDTETPTTAEVSPLQKVFDQLVELGVRILSIGGLQIPLITSPITMIWFVFNIVFAGFGG